MLVKCSSSDELRQGDQVYLPCLKQRGIYAVKDRIWIPAAHEEFRLTPDTVVMRYQGLMPWHVTERGVRTGEVIWVPTEGL